MPQLTTSKYQLPNCLPFAITIISDGKAITHIGFSHDAMADDSAADEICRDAAKQIKEWFEGNRKDFDLPLKPEKYEKSLNKLREVSYGETVDYEKLAEICGYKPGAAIAAGNVCSGNTIPLIFPCHRVLKKNRSLGNFGVFKDMKTDDPRNLAIKRALIEHEARYA